MSEQTTKSFQLAARLATQMKLKRIIAWDSLHQQGHGVITIPFDSFWSEADAAALDDFEEHEKQLQGFRKLPFPKE
jgi:hypothetical protein